MPLVHGVRDNVETALSRRIVPNDGTLAIERSTNDSRLSRRSRSRRRSKRMRRRRSKKGKKRKKHGNRVV